jgi:hypothetical protein
MELYLRVHTVVERGNWAETSVPYEDRWAKKALIFDCETTTDARQTFNFAFYRKCALRNGSYVCTEEGIVYADDLEQRLGKHAVELLTTFARKTPTDTVRGRRAKMRVYPNGEIYRFPRFLLSFLTGRLRVGQDWTLRPSLA